MRILVPALVLVPLLLSGCEVDENVSSLSFRLEDAPVAGARSASNAQVEALFLGEIEVVLYDHRPGEALQVNSDFGNNVQDWSFMSPLLSGHTDARDNLVESSGALDLAALAGVNILGDPDATYQADVGYFDVDIFEISVYRTGLVYDTVGNNDVADFGYWGWTTLTSDDQGNPIEPLHKYSQYANVPVLETLPHFPGYRLPAPESIQDMNILFVSDELLADRRLVRLGEDPANASQYDRVLFDSLAGTQPLTTAETDLLLSLANQGTGRRFYTNLLVVPFAGPVRLVYDAQAPGYQAAPPAAMELQAANVEIAVGISLNNLLDEAATNLTAAHQPQLVDMRVTSVAPPHDYSFTLDGTPLTFSVTYSAGETPTAELAAQRLAGQIAQDPTAEAVTRVNANGDTLQFTSPWEQGWFELTTTDPKLDVTVVQELGATVVFAGDAAGIPFGLTYSISEKTAVCATGTAYSLYTGSNAGGMCPAVGQGTRSSACCTCPGGTRRTPVQGSSQFTCN